MKRREKAVRLVLCLLLAGVLVLFSACGGAKAAAMRLRKAQGEVRVADDQQKAVALAEELGLYSGYSVGTQAESYAWIDLDSVKLTKMDAESRVEIQKKGKSLEILVKSGSLFFNATEPLGEDETMDIRTADLLVGIRGTCGWVDAERNLVALLEGKVQCEAAGGTSVTVSAGEKAELTESGGLVVTPLTEEDIPAFVLAELADGEDPGEEYPEGSDKEHQESPGPEIGPVVTLTMPVTAEEIQSYLYIPIVQTVIVRPGDEAGALVVERREFQEDPLIVLEGKKLILEEGVSPYVIGEPPIVMENGEELHYALSNYGTLEIGSDILCDGIVFNTGTITVRGTFTLAEDMKIQNEGEIEGDISLIEDLAEMAG